VPLNSKSRFSNLLFYAVVLCLMFFVFRVFQPFLVPLGWAAVFAVIFYSLNKWLGRRWGHTLSALAMTIGVALILVLPVLLLATMFVREGFEATRKIQSAVAAGGYGWVNRAWEWFSLRVAQQGFDIDLPGLIHEGASRVGESMAEGAGWVVRNLVTFLFELFVMLFALFYLLRDGDSVLARFRLFLPFEEAMRDRMLAEARELVFASVTTSLVISAADGLICGGAFAIAGIGSPVFWGVVMAFLSLLPVIGAWPVWIPAAIWLFSTGQTGRAVLLIAICGGLTAAVDNILRPLILGGRASLNALLVFISVLGGIATFGVLGIVMGPIVVATAVGILDVYAGKDVKHKPAVSAEH
jgi:predicted PurR-regulated permease PerM